jgi:YidC/Oxa1 family membrane protein insertase
MPNRSEAEIAADEMWHSKIFPIRVGTKNTDWRTLTDISFRMWSKPTELQANEAIEHSYTIFAGPKDTAILAEYGLNETISYGWFWFAAQPLLAFLHFLHGLGLPYAMAIIVLTICVRLLLLPLSIKQAYGAIKMQEISPELRAIAEKHKDDMQARSNAQRELFQKHGYNPLSGCLPIFIQLPIFIGLYKALAVDAGLYGAPLISSSVRWCNDLSAPDMLYNWSGFWNWLGWTSFNTGQGILALGPYISLLPILTIVLFIGQMMLTMPPATDDQSRMQRQMIYFMMPMMGLMFFKFPSGLCLYFTISTIWGLVERRFIPKPKPKSADAAVAVTESKQSESKKSSGKKGGKTREPQTPPKQEGRFTRWMREVMEKAAEQQKLGQQKQNRDKDKKKKKR